jgi:hypothetical protein
MVKQVKQNRSSGSAWIRTCRSKVSEQHIAELIMARVMEGDSEEEIASEVATLLCRRLPPKELRSGAPQVSPLRVSGRLHLRGC